MDELKNVYHFITDLEFSIPVGEVMLFVGILSLLLLYGKHKVGLIVTFCFVLYWGFVINFNYFFEHLGKTTLGLPLYVFFGISVLVLAIIGFFIETRD